MQLASSFGSRRKHKKGNQNVRLGVPRYRDAGTHNHVSRIAHCSMKVRHERIGATHHLGISA